jgi:hypothetical protein
MMTCAVCHKNSLPLVALPCGHAVHAACLSCNQCAAEATPWTRPVYSVADVLGGGAEVYMVERLWCEAQDSTYPEVICCSGKNAFNKTIFVAEPQDTPQRSGSVEEKERLDEMP